MQRFVVVKKLGTGFIDVGNHVHTVDITRPFDQRPGFSCVEPRLQHV